MGAGLPKQLMLLGGRAVVARAIAAVGRARQVGVVIVCCPPGMEEEFTRIAEGVALGNPVEVVPGGATRQQSVLAGLRRARELGAEWVVVHDGARPLASSGLVERVLAAARTTGAAVAGMGMVETVKEVEGEFVVRTLDRTRLVSVQTPQAFRLGLVLEALERVEQEGVVVTDEAAAVERIGGKVRVVEGERSNIKLTTPEDMALARAVMGLGVRVGVGLDAHRFAPGRVLVLGGVEVEWDMGLEGHSDADVLTHAVMDGLLGAAGLGDIGAMFPPGDPEWKDATSTEMLRLVCRRLEEEGFEPLQVSAVVIAQAPRLKPYIEKMRLRLAEAMGIDPGAVNVAATTTEGMGFTGRGEGIAAMATAVVGGR